jgi:hypothetical protein
VVVVWIFLPCNTFIVIYIDVNFLTLTFKKIIEKTGDNETKIKAIKNAKRYILICLLVLALTKWKMVQ